MNLERISDVLQSYTGQEESMHAVASVLQEELGENWTETVFDDLKSLPPALKDNLTHAFNYYAATMAWNEIQGYLAEENLQVTPELQERLPILKHWLDFFGAPGQTAYQELEMRLFDNDAKQETVHTDEQPLDDDVTQTDMENGVDTIVDDDSLEKEETPNSDEIEAAKGADAVSEIKDENKNDVDTENMDIQSAVHIDTPEAFEIEKLKKQITLLDQNQAWLAARCIQLKGIEVYSYPFYGYIVDMMRQIVKNMNDIKSDATKSSLLNELFEGGQAAFENKKQAVEHDIELAEQNCESATTALISEDMDMDEVKRTLGTIDESDTVEYVGPAPDGFELIDDETPLDENAIKKQYEKLENMDALTGDKTQESEENSSEIKENASQSTQKGVQRKLSFSLKKKKPVGDANA